MTGPTQSTTVGPLPTPSTDAGHVPRVLTRVVWALWALSVVAVGAYLWHGAAWTVGGLVLVDGLTVAMWVAVTFFGGVVHSYARRYMAGEARVERFFGGVFAFTLVVMVLVAADHLALYAAAWLGMGLVMAELIGHVDDWPQARAAGALARRYFLASSGLVAAAALVLWTQAGVTTVSGVGPAVGALDWPVLVAVAGPLVLAAMVQSALVPFHTWLLSSMTAPTPASALMHAGFVNAGGLLLVRFAPVVTAEAGVMLAVVLVGATSALGGKLLKTVQPDVKGKLGCSTVGQMGFMIMQAGLGFFAAALTHLVLHGCYKAYQFLAAGSRVEHTAPTKGADDGSAGVAGLAVVGLTGLAAGAVFAALTGKGTALDAGLLLTGLVVLTVVHAVHAVVSTAELPAALRYVGLPVVAVPAVAGYALVYRAFEGLVPVGQPAELTVVHGVVAVAFLAVYVALETGTHRHSERLYVALVNATQPPAETQLTDTEVYDA